VLPNLTFFLPKFAKKIFLAIAPLDTFQKLPKKLLEQVLTIDIFFALV
jgi:hypothetical protein